MDLENRLEKLGDRLQSIVSQIKDTEMLDSVSITVTYQEENNTAIQTFYAGNWYANYGAMTQYLKRQDLFKDEEG